jgi:hypothetical protein
VFQMVSHHWRGAFSAVVLALLLGAHAANAEESVRFKKFRTFFELLDQTGGLADEFQNVNGDICRMDGIVCVGGDTVEMCVNLLKHVYVQPNATADAAKLRPVNSIKTN